MPLIHLHYSLDGKFGSSLTTQTLHCCDRTTLENKLKIGSESTEPDREAEEGTQRTEYT